MHSRRLFLQQLSQLGLGLGFTSLANHGFFKENSPNASIPLIIDADTANEVDDLYAIARALLEPKFDLKGITAAQWHFSPLAPRDTVGESHKLNQEILRLLNREEVPLAIGSNVPMVNKVRPQKSEAAELIIQQARAIPDGQKLKIAILGATTNPASALLMAPEIASKIAIYYLGFWHHFPSGTWNKREFNTGNDPQAVNALIDHPEVEFHVMTATTSQQLQFYKKEVDQQLSDKGKIGPYLIHRWESFDRWWQETDKEKTQWTMWDVALIEALANPEFATEQQVLAPYDNLAREIYAYTDIDEEKMMEAFWKAFEIIK